MNSRMKLFLGFVLLLGTMPIYAFGPTHAGKYAFTYQDAYVTGDRFSLRYENGNWWLEDVEPADSKKIINCEKVCQLSKSSKKDVEYFLQNSKYFSNEECINNKEFAICSVNVESQSEKLYLFVHINQYPPRQSVLARLDSVDKYKNGEFTTNHSDSMDGGQLFEYFVGLGVWFGGDIVAINPDGDDYDAGSGAVIGAGFSYSLFDDINIKHANSVAIRYQGAKSGKGENKGFVIETSLVKEWTDIGVGAGLHFDFLNEVSDTNGNNTVFKNSLGTIVFVEWIVEEKINIIFKYLFMDYETTDGVPYDGNQYGIYMTFKLGGKYR